jgi:hypothetical protein
MLKSMGEMESVGPSLGSFSVSKQLLELFLNGFKTELTSKVRRTTIPRLASPRLALPDMFTTLTYDSFRFHFLSQTGKFDSDPHLWMPMTLGEKEYVELMQQKGKNHQGHPAPARPSSPSLILTLTANLTTTFTGRHTHHLDHRRGCEGIGRAS